MKTTSRPRPRRAKFDLEHGAYYRVTAIDHNLSGDPNDTNTVDFLGLYIGKTVKDGRRFLRLASVFYSHDGSHFATIGSAIRIIEREVVRVVELVPRPRRRTR